MSRLDAAVVGSGPNGLAAAVTVRQMAARAALRDLAVGAAVEH